MTVGLWTVKLLIATMLKSVFFNQKADLSPFRAKAPTTALTLHEERIAQTVSHISGSKRLFSTQNTLAEDGTGRQYDYTQSTVGVIIY